MKKLSRRILAFFLLLPFLGITEDLPDRNLSPQDLRTELLRPVDKRTLSPDALCQEIFATGDTSLVNLCFEDKSLVTAALRDIAELPPSAFKDQVLLLMLRAGPTMWLPDNFVGDNPGSGVGMTVRNAAIHICQYSLAPYVTKADLDRCPLDKRENRLKIAEIFEQALAGRSHLNPTAPSQTMPAEKPTPENATQAAPKSAEVHPLNAPRPPAEEGAKKPEVPWPWVLGMVVLAVLLLIWKRLK